jgi:hypothetical protein
MNLNSLDYAEHTSQEFGLVKISGDIDYVRSYQGSWNNPPAEPPWIAAVNGIPVYYPNATNQQNEAVTVEINNTTTISTTVWNPYSSSGGGNWAVQITAIAYTEFPP